MKSKIFILLLAACCVSCTPVDGVLFGAKTLWSGSSFFYKVDRVYNECSLFKDHWKILNQDHLDEPKRLKDVDKKRLEDDLQNIALQVSKQFKPLIKANPLLEAEIFGKRYPKMKVEVQLSNEVFAYAKQDPAEPVIVISSGLLAQNLERFGQMMLDQKAKYKETHREMVGDELYLALKEEIEIPRALEYKDSLIFLIAHESVHLLLDPPLRAGDQTKEMEARADTLGLLMAAKTSFIVEIKQTIFGMTNFYLINNGATAESAYDSVRYARYGPEIMFDVHRHSFSPGSAGIYQSVDERIAGAKAYMRSEVQEGIHTDYGTMLSYLFSRL